MSTKLIFDPLSIPVESFGSEPGIVPAQLSADALRRRFAQPPVWQPERMGDDRLDDVNLRFNDASVLMPIVLRPSGATLLFTTRTAHLSNHAGQVSFPGGRREEGDATPVETALRETEEEIGLHRRHIEVLGTLPDYLTVTGYRITPVAALVIPPFSLVPDPQEVDEVFEVPMAYLMDGRHHQRRTIEASSGARRRSFYSMSYERFFIWGATAGMLRNLFHFLRA